MNQTIRGALSVIAILFIVSSCTAQTQSSDTPSVSQAKAWLDAFNAGDMEKYKEFLRKSFPSRVERADGDVGFREMTGGFELKKVEESTPTKTVALVQERQSDQIARMTVEVEAAEPHRITQLNLRPIPRPAEFPLPHLSEGELVPALRTKLDEEVKAGRFAGAALIARNGKPVFSQAYGLADRENKTPNTMKTRFRVGSMNKMFTAVATMQLVNAHSTSSRVVVGGIATTVFYCSA